MASEKRLLTRARMMAGMKKRLDIVSSRVYNIWVLLAGARDQSSHAYPDTPGKSQQ